MCCPLFTPSCSLSLSLPCQCHFLSLFFTSSSLLLALHSRSHLSPPRSAHLTITACSFTASTTSVLALPSFLTCLVLPPHVWLRRSGRCFFFFFYYSAVFIRLYLSSHPKSLLSFRSDSTFQPSSLSHSSASPFPSL